MVKKLLTSSSLFPKRLLSCIVCLAVVHVFDPAVWPAEPSLTGEVGEFGLPARLEVTGLKAISNDRLRKALGADGQIGWASLPLASLREYLDVVRARAIVGLQRDGFLEPRVAVRADLATGKVLVTVEEGPRFLAGDIRVLGGSQEVREHLVRWLTTAQPPVDATPEFADTPQGQIVGRWVDKDGSEADLVEPLWIPGKAAPCDPVAHERLATDARRAISELRGDTARLQVEISPSDLPGTADLVIEIFDEGQPAVIREVVVNGGQRDSREDVLAYLGLAEGQTALPSNRLRWEQMLRLSGRYRRQSVQMQRLFGRNDVVVQIDLVEYPPASPIAKPLTHAEQTMLKCREWLMRTGERGEDHRFSLCEMVGDRWNECEIVLAPDRGFYASFKSTAGGGPPRVDSGEVVGTTQPSGLGTAPLAAEVIAMTLTNERFAIHLPTLGKKLELPVAMSAQLVLSLGTALADPADGKADYGPGERPFKTTLGAGVKSIRSGEREAPVAMEFVFTPVYFMAQLYEHETRVEREGDVLKVSSPAQVIRVDSRTGRLVEMALQSDGDTAGGWTIVQGGLARKLAELDAVPAKNLFDPRRPVSSSVAFLSEAMRLWKRPAIELVAATEKQRGVAAETDDQLAEDRSQLDQWKDVARVLEIIARISADGQLQDVDEAILAWASRRDDEGDGDLWIPSKPDGRANHMMRYLSGCFLRGLDEVFERDTWPSMAGRTLACMLCGETKLVGSEMQRLFWNSDIGPVGCLLLSHWTPDPRANLAFAQRGLDLLSVDGFRRERAALLAPLERYGLLPLAVSALRRLQPEEAKDLGRIVFHDEHSLSAMVEQLRAAPNVATAVATLPVTLDAVWEGQLSDRVKKNLGEQVRRVAAQPLPPPR